MWNQIPREKKKELIERIQSYFYDERDEEIGELAAENFLHFVMAEIGTTFYNAGISDAIGMTEQKWLSIEQDLEALKKADPK
ncbi:DUF2164 domain-containing protein [Guptibacillus hwajinpoensis]|uniref:DUF2164 domain-containing protein n=1 Tax=Guptibacillus hwajinpoensis TaxID=208199 RepID=UPI00273F1603|nr:DUF2164 domain-containing protein [Pseudalkalibacillus hwajinpoensis]WLR61704.1 DUF2164 domain-containing protein [Pseudalkalibacillus hwajinpoensis]